MPSKLDIIDGAFKLLRISGITVNATNGEVVDALQTLDDYNAELKTMMDTGYIQPVEYGQSDPNDFSGLTAEMAGPMKKIMTIQLAPFFAKDIPPALAAIASSGMRSLEHLLVHVGNAQNPATLPIGSGNESTFITNKFYNEPNNDEGAETYYSNEVFQLPIDWNSWLADEFTLTSVSYDADSGILLTNEAVVDGVSVVTIAFSKTGQFNMCAIATNSNGDVKNQRFTFNSIDCKQARPYFP
tara:strand:+ start:8030 stop:8755 length:726 start_codon:yes stop_codon:yes gene_type:complete